jgi:hypothetical protein
MDEYRRLQLAQSSGSTTLIDSDNTATSTTDLDSLLTGVYRYYKEGGFRATIARSVLNVLASSFTFILSFVVLLMVDWENVIACVSEEICNKLSLFNDSVVFPLTLYRFIVLVQLLPLGVYAVALSIIACIARVREAVRISTFFKESLFVLDDDELQFISWAEIVERISRYQSSSTSPLCIVQDTLSVIEIQNIIMRTESIHLAIMKEWSKSTCGGILTIPLHSRAIQWCIHHGVVSWLFDDRYRIREGSIASVGVRIKFVGFVTLAMMGPLAIFAAFLIIIMESDEVRSNKTSLFEKEWSMLARTVVRHQLEPDIWLDERLEAARDSGLSFSEMLITDRTKKSLLRTIKFLCAGILSVLASIALVQDSALLYMTIGGKSLLFFLAIFSGLLAISAGLDDTQNSRNPNPSCDAKISTGLRLMSLIRSDMHIPNPYAIYGSQDDVGRARQVDEISRDFSRNFLRPKIINILFEFAGIITLPFFFLFVFPDRLSEIIRVIPLVRSESLGDFYDTGCLGARALSEQSHEMVRDVFFSSLRDRERLGTHLMLYEKFGIESEMMEKILDFKKACMQSPRIVNIDKSLIESIWFWYALLRELTMSEGDLSLLRLNPELSKLGQDGLECFSRTRPGNLVSGA